MIPETEKSTGGEKCKPGRLCGMLRLIRVDTLRTLLVFSRDRSLVLRAPFSNMLALINT